MKKAAIISLLLSVVMLIMIINLGGEIEELSLKLTNTQNDLANKINELESFIKHSQEEQASILASYDWEYVNEDRQNRNVTVKVCVAPKEYSTTTEAFFVCNGTEYPMTLENGTFTGSIEASFADKIAVSQFIFKDGDKVRAEAVDFDASPKYKYLADIYAEFAGSYGSTLEKEVPKFTLEGDMIAEIHSEDADFEFKKVELSIHVNDKEVKRILLNKDEHTAPLYYRTTLNEEYDVKYGDTVSMYIEAVDSFNWKYRTLAGGVTVVSEGEMAEDMAIGMTEIYNEKGELLFEDSEYY